MKIEIDEGVLAQVLHRITNKFTVQVHHRSGDVSMCLQGDPQGWTHHTAVPGHGSAGQSSTAVDTPLIALTRLLGSGDVTSITLGEEQIFPPSEEKR